MKWLAAGTLLLSLLAVAVLTTGGDESDPKAAVRVDRTIRCDRTSTYRPVPVTARDEALAPGVQINGFRGNFAEADAAEVFSPRPGIEALKAPIIFTGSRDLTLAVPRSHQGVLSLDYAPARRGVDTVAEGDSSVRFRACPARLGATGHAGGILYAGPWPACVPLYVSVGGRRPQRRLLSLGAGSCR